MSVMEGGFAFGFVGFVGHYETFAKRSAEPFNHSFCLLTGWLFRDFSSYSWAILTKGSRAGGAASAIMRSFSDLKPADAGAAFKAERINL